MEYLSDSTACILKILHTFIYMFSIQKSIGIFVTLSLDFDIGEDMLCRSCQLLACFADITRNYQTLDQILTYFAHMYLTDTRVAAAPRNGSCKRTPASASSLLSQCPNNSSGQVAQLNAAEVSSVLPYLSSLSFAFPLSSAQLSSDPERGIV